MPKATVTADAVQKVRERMLAQTVSAEEMASTTGVSFEAFNAFLSGKGALSADALTLAAEKLNMQPEELFTPEKEAREEDSPYFKAVQGGLLAVKRLESERDQVNIPDATGKYFIEYVLDNGDNKLFEYMLSGRGLPLYPSENKARALLRIASGCLRCKLNPENYLESFLTEAKKGDFSGEAAEEFLSALERYSRADLLEKVLSHNVTSVKKVFGPITKTHTSPLVLREDVLTMIAKLKAERLLTELLPTLPSYKAACYTLSEQGFLNGLLLVLEKLYFSDVALATAIEQNCAVYAVKGGKMETLTAMVNRGNTENEGLLLLALAENKEDCAEFLITKVARESKPRLALKAAAFGRMQSFLLLTKDFRPDTEFYDKALAISKAEAVELNRYLVSKGARFTQTTLYTTEKANALFSDYEKEKE
ncbi:MAG: helix-turn-helix transcriptional regulator [Clostridia bacterium]|nr:helix-turn-helix transcriptional regulator [Clostridia bacterium]